MILGGKAIQEAFTSYWQAYRNGEAMTKDQMFDAIGPNSFDVTLGGAIMTQKMPYTIKPLADNNMPYVAGTMKTIKLTPGQFMLGVTQERFVTDLPLIVELETYPSDDSIAFNIKFVQKYDGRSTMGRLGIASHVTAGFGDYGFKDYWTLELVNLGSVPVVLHAGMRIGQISFEAVYEPSKYEGAYTDVSDLPTPKPPKLGKDRF